LNELNEKNFNQSGFTVPDGYFDGIEDAVFSKITEDTIPKETGFTVPENYFETLEEQVVSKIAPHRKRGKLRSLIVRFTTSAAAVLLLIFGISQYNQTTSITFDSLTTTEINDWIIEEGISIDSYEIADITETTSSYSNFPESISDQELNDYLDTTDSDFLFIEN
jgi:hypothetical protein